MITTKSNGRSDRELIQINRSDITAQELAPRLDWSELRESQHFAQFYETDDFLLNALSGFIGAGLSTGEAGIVVTTRTHGEGLEELLQKYGLDLGTARASGQYVLLDAAETLSKFMVDGSPDPARFIEVLGDIVAHAAQGRRGVRIFGEMVALLWTEGKYDAAIRLEGLWNNLRETHSFVLLCGYPISGFDDEALAMPLSDVCAEHSHVLPAESYTALINPDDRMRAIILLQRKARLLQAEIAERKAAEEALRTVKDELEQLLVRERMARAEAERANRMKDEFLAIVSHELRTPLTTIIGWSQRLRKRRHDETTIARGLEIIERNAKSQAQLIEDILDVSRVITGKLRLSIGLVDLVSVVNAAIDSVQLAADSRGIHLVVTLDPSARHISGDANRLQQVFWNLLSNAIKFTPAGGRVEVRLERAGANVQISVSDTGEGISVEFLPFIFDHFRQADGTSTRRHGGLGLGLAIVRHLVELHGGSVSADSPGEGCGATFTIRLPLAAAHEHAKGRRSDAGNARRLEDDNARLKRHPSLDGVQVLLVDDDQDTLQILIVTLTECGARIQAATSVAEAVEVLQWYKPDVLVSDLAMPDQDGYSFIDKLRALETENGKQTPAVALTAYARVEDRMRALSAGFNMFVPKPVEPDELIAVIANLLEPDTTEFARAEMDG